MLSFIKKLYSGYVYIFLEHKLQNHTYTVHTSHHFQWSLIDSKKVLFVPVVDSVEQT